MAGRANRSMLGTSPAERVARVVGALVVVAVGLSVLISGMYWAIIFCPIIHGVSEWLIWLMKRRFPPKTPRTAGS